MANTIYKDIEIIDSYLVNLFHNLNNYNSIYSDITKQINEKKKNISFKENTISGTK